MNTGSKLLVIAIFNMLTFDFVEARQTTFASSDREVVGTRAVFDLSKIDEAVTEQLKKAWEYSRCGTTYLEGLVFIYRNSDGSYRARALPPNNEFDKLTFKWDPEAIAVAHTHPNSCNPRPTSNDKQLADRYRVPMFTISSDGMFMYDPTTKATTRVQNNLDWMKVSNWTRRSLEGSHGTRSRR
jgi:hypothetical protein